MVEQRKPVSSICAVKQTKPRPFPTGSKEKMKTKSDGPKTPCWQCGEMHYVRDCTYTKHVCRDCKETGHKEGYCGCYTSTATTSKKKKPVNGIFCVNQVSCTSRRKFLTVDINGSQATLQMNTASDIIIILQKVWRKNLGSPSLTTTTRTAKTASGNQLHLLGELQCSVTVGGVTKNATFHVTKNGINLFGLDWIKLFELWDTPLSSICNQVQATSDHINQVVRTTGAERYGIDSPTFDCIIEERRYVNLHDNGSLEDMKRLKSCWCKCRCDL
ncbi:uncharacterized protein LOC115255269 [Aedes albopictus]|uniref:Uncharacterized protein n=1 Tax=Aedes albopictus TaxID=7160 RepID=A0ABM1Z736_AEDAL